MYESKSICRGDSKESDKPEYRNNMRNDKRREVEDMLECFTKSRQKLGGDF